MSGRFSNQPNELIGDHHMLVVGVDAIGVELIEYRSRTQAITYGDITVGYPIASGRAQTSRRRRGKRGGVHHRRTVKP
jgi:hypothetical protein